MVIYDVYEIYYRNNTKFMWSIKQKHFGVWISRAVTLYTYNVAQNMGPIINSDNPRKKIKSGAHRPV